MKSDIGHDLLVEQENDQTDRLSLKDFMQAIRERSRLVIASVVFCVALAALYLFIAPPVYTITMVVAPAPAGNTKQPASSLSSLGSSISGLISGAPSGSSSLAPMDEFLQLIISPRVTQTLIKQDPTILPKIFSKQWDADSKTWHPPHDPISLISRLVYTIFGMPSWSQPTAQSLALYLQSNLVIAEVNTTAMQSVTFTFKDPQFAVRLLTMLQKQADKVIRIEAQDLADKQIEYLQQKLNETTAVDYRATLLSLISSQVTTRMSINATLPYAAMMVQPAVSTDLPTGPNPFVWITVGIVVGLLLGVFMALGAALIWPNGIPSLSRLTNRIPGVRRGWHYLSQIRSSAK